MFKFIEEKDLPLEYIGEEKETCQSVYKITSVINSDIRLSLKAHSFINSNTTLITGETLDNCWVKQI